MTATILAPPVPSGPPADPRWVRPALLALLGTTALLYLWGLGASGYANTFYSAAVQAGATSWKAFFFGSSDAANSIMVDKPPASLWVMALSARLFGVNAWSILVPQALEGVATAGVLYAAVRRWHGPVAGLLAGGVLALTPVAVLIFRFDNPDALLVLLLTTAAYAMVRAVEAGRTGWLVAASVWFLTKMMQAFLVVPGFALAYAAAAPGPVRRRIGQLLMAGVSLLVSAGAWAFAPRSCAGLAAVAAGGRADRWPGLRWCAGRARAGAAPVGLGGGGRRGAARACGVGRLRRGHGGHPAPRCHPLRWTPQREGFGSRGFVGRRPSRGGRGDPGGFAGLLDGTTSNTVLNALLTRDADRYTWVAPSVRWASA